MGWKVEEKTYYYDEKGNMVKGWLNLDNKWYYLHQDYGFKMTGLIEVKGTVYYLDVNGVMLTGWQQIDNKWYYFNADGSMVKGWLELDNKKYYMNQDTGSMMQGWIDLKGKIYCANTDGTIIINGFHTLCGKLYYFNKDGLLLENDRKLKGKVTASVLNVRDSMSTNSNIIGTLNKDQVVEIGLDYTTNLDWYSIYFGEHGGFVSSKYIEILENQEEVLETTGDSLISKQLVDFVKSYEGFFPNHYDDGVGVDTIGYGSTHGWIMKLSTCTKEQATKALMEEINAMAVKIKDDLNSKGIHLKQCEFDSLCSFAYNCGTGALFSSTLYKTICAGVRDSSLKANFTAWCHGGGRVMQGLLNRRIEEFNVFANADYRRDL